MRPAVLAIAVASSLWAGEARPAPDASWSAQLFAGTAWSLPAPLVVRQPGFPDLRIAARWDTHALAGSPYYAWRVGRQRGDRGWELELVHHKVHLANPPREIEKLEISHGYNLVSLLRAWRRPTGVLRIGLGVVVAHPEGRVRGQPVDPVRSLVGWGFHLAGPTAQVAFARPVALGRGFDLVPEIKWSASWARIPLAGGGGATVPNSSIHAHVGLGFRR